MDDRNDDPRLWSSTGCVSSGATRRIFDGKQHLIVECNGQCGNNGPSRYRIDGADEGHIRQAALNYLKPPRDDSNQTGNEGEEIGEGADQDIKLTELTTLMLSFHNIYRIDNLQGYEKLTKLQLDNNVIDRIENLDHLVNLTWLDLSFNNITKIENLNKLVHLTDLSLFHNHINVIENLDSLSNLNVLSLGNNNIKDVENIIYLRQFHNLRLLNLAGNPVCQEDDYLTTVFAYLKNLFYLDYETIDPAQVSKAKEDKQAQLLELEEIEKLQAQEAVAANKKRLFKEALQKANLAGLDELFDDMIKEDGEILRLQQLPGFKNVLQSYREKAEKAISEFIEKILAASAAEQDEVAIFRSAVSNLIARNETSSLERIRKFNSAKKRMLAELIGGYTQSAPDATLITKLREAIQDLSDDLMDLEMQCSEEVADCVGEFEGAISRMTKQNIEQMTNFFRVLEDLERIYWEDLGALVHNLIDKYHNSQAQDNPLVSEADIALSTILSEKEALETSISNSHNNHLEKILKFGDEVLDRASKTVERLSSEASQQEYHRNRRRVAEIFDLLGELSQQASVETAKPES